MKRKGSLDKYLEQLEKEREGLRDSLERARLEKDGLKQKIDQLQSGLNQLEDKEEDTGFRALKKRYGQEKEEFQKSINGSSDRVKRIQQELHLLDRDVSRYEKEKQTALARRGALKEELNDVKNALLLEIGQRKALEAEIKRGTEIIQEQEAAVKEEIEQMKAYRQNLELAVKKYDNAQAAASQQIDMFDKTAGELQGMYDMEQQWLKEKESVLRRYADYAAKIQEGKDRRLSLAASKEELLAKKKGQSSEVELLRSQIKRELESADRLEEERKRVSAEIDEIAMEIKNGMKAPVRRGDRSHEKALKKEISDKKAALRHIEKKLKGLKQANSRLSSQLVQKESVRADLQSLEQKGREEWQSALAADEAGRPKNDIIDNQGQAQRQGRLEEEVDALKLRSSILSSSLATIEKKYDADQIAVKEFKMEKEQLLEYLSMLIHENQGLEAKIGSLEKGLEF
jgi:chromosome segregation ATPase